MSAIRKNLLSLFLSQVATWVVSLLILVRVPELLGDEQFGVISFVFAYIGFFTLIAGLGTSTYLTREVARDHAVVGRYMVSAIALKVLLVALLSMAAIALAIILGYHGTTLTLMVIGCVGMLFIEVNGDIVGALAGMERMAKSSVLGVVQVYVASLGGLLVLSQGGGVIGYSVVGVMAAAIPLVANSVLIWPYIRDSLHVDRRVWKVLARGGLPLLVLTGFNLIYGTLDIPLLEFIAGSREVGWYALAYKWVSIPIFMSTAVVAAYFPRFAALGKTHDPEFPVQVNRAILFTSIVAVPAAVGLGVVASDLLGFFYSDDFSKSVPLMQILAIHIPVAAVDTIMAMSLIAIDRQRKYIVVAGCAAVLNPIACIIAIHVTMRTHDNGAIGAAIVTVGTEVLILGAALLIRPNGVMDRATQWMCLRIVAAGVTMGVVVLLSSSLPLPVQIVVGIVTYGAASVALRTIALSDVRRVLGQVSGAVRSGRRGVGIAEQVAADELDGPDAEDGLDPEVVTRSGGEPPDRR